MSQCSILQGGGWHHSGAQLAQTYQWKPSLLVSWTERILLSKAAQPLIDSLQGFLFFTVNIHPLKYWADLIWLLDLARSSFQDEGDSNSKKHSPNLGGKTQI